MAVKKSAWLWISMFVLAIIGVAFMQSVSDTTTQITSTYTTTNQSIPGQALGTNTTLNGKNVFGTTTVQNRSFNGVNWTTIGTGNYTVVQVTKNGKQTVEFQLKTATYANQALNATYSWEPEGYLEEPGSRNITLLILLIMAISLIIFILVSLFEMEGLKNMLKIGRR